MLVNDAIAAHAVHRPGAEIDHDKNLAVRQGAGDRPSGTYSKVKILPPGFVSQDRMKEDPPVLQVLVHPPAGHAAPGIGFAVGSHCRQGFGTGSWRRNGRSGPKAPGGMAGAMRWADQRTKAGRRTGRNKCPKEGQNRQAAFRAGAKAVLERIAVRDAI